MCLGTPFSALPPAQCFLLSSLPSTFTGSSSYQYDLPCGVRERVAEAGKAVVSIF